MYTKFKTQVVDLISLPNSPSISAQSACDFACGSDCHHSHLIGCAHLIGCYAHLIGCHVHRLVADMGKALDWMTEQATEKGYQVTRINQGPGKNFFIGLHPEMVKSMFKAGNVFHSFYEIMSVLISRLR